VILAVVTAIVTLLDVFYL